MARTLHSRIPLALAAASLLAVVLRVPGSNVSGHVHSHDHRHGLPAAGQERGDTSASDAAIEKLLSGTTAGTQASSDLRLVFNLSKLTDGQKRWARAILGEGCDFGWDRLVGPLAGRKIKIVLGDPPARAMFYPGELRLVIQRYFYREERTEASRLLGWEIAHAIDLLVMSDDDRHAIVDLYHSDDTDNHGWLSGSYEDQVGEAFMEGFVAAFCPALSVEPMFGHETTSEIADGIRSQLS